jgi:hypothetical protein
VNSIDARTHAHTHTARSTQTHPGGDGLVLRGLLRQVLLAHARRADGQSVLVYGLRADAVVACGSASIACVCVWSCICMTWMRKCAHKCPESTPHTQPYLQRRVRASRGGHACTSQSGGQRSRTCRNSATSVCICIMATCVTSVQCTHITSRNITQNTQMQSLSYHRALVVRAVWGRVAVAAAAACR